MKSNSFTDQLGQKVSWEAFGFNSFHRPALTQARGFWPKTQGVISNQLTTAVCSSRRPSLLTCVNADVYKIKPLADTATESTLSSYLSSGASSWFCGTYHSPPEQASCHSCWWAEGAVWVWGPGSSTRANLQRTSGYLSYLMHIYNAHTHRHTRVKKALSMKKSRFLSMHFKMGSAWPASAGWNGPDPVRFFTGRAGTLQRTRQRDSGLTEQQHRRRLVSFKWTNLHCTSEEQKLLLRVSQHSQSRLQSSDETIWPKVPETPCLFNVLHTVDHKRSCYFDWAPTSWWVATVRKYLPLQTVCPTADWPISHEVKVSKFYL